MTVHKDSTSERGTIYATGIESMMSGALAVYWGPAGVQLEYTDNSTDEVFPMFDVLACANWFEIVSKVQSLNPKHCEPLLP